MGAGASSRVAEPADNGAFDKVVPALTPAAAPDDSTKTAVAAAVDAVPDERAKDVINRLFGTLLVLVGAALAAERVEALANQIRVLAAEVGRHERR